MSMVDEAASTTDITGSADPDDVPGAEPSAKPSPPAAAEPDVEAVAPFNRVETAERLKQTLREEKHARLRTLRRQSKPSGASAHAWKYFQTYVQVRIQCYDICCSMGEGEIQQI